MGEAADRTLREIAAARAALERDLDELQDRMPPGSTVKRGVAAAGGGGAALTAILAILKKLMERRSEEQTIAKDAAIQARAIAAAFAAAQEERDRNVTAAAHEAARDAHRDEEGGNTGLWILLVAILGAIVAVVLKQKQAGHAEDLWLDESETPPV